MCQDYANSEVAVERTKFVVREAEKMKIQSNIQKIEANLQAQIDVHNRGLWDDLRISIIKGVILMALGLAGLSLYLVIASIWIGSKREQRNRQLKKLAEELDEEIRVKRQPIALEMEKLEDKKKKQEISDLQHDAVIKTQQKEFDKANTRKSQAKSELSEVLESIESALCTKAKIVEDNIKLIKIGEIVSKFDSAEAKRSIQDLSEALILIKTIKI